MAAGKIYIGPYRAQPAPSTANLQLVAQAAAISATGLIGGVAETGLWRANLWITTDTAGTAGTIQLTVSATQGGTDSVGNFSLPPIPVAGFGNASGSFVFQSNGSADIFYATTFLGVTVGSLQYSVRIVLEQLSR